MTGHDGYIGSVMAPVLTEAGHEVIGLDTGFFAECGFGDYAGPAVEGRTADVREAAAFDLSGFDAVVHLAALSNDPLGNLDADLTYQINHRASVGLARRARDAGVGRFVFASSCSLYGAQGDAFLDEAAGFNPITPYGNSKILSEQDIAKLATDDFSPTFMRNATAYGVSPRLRADVVVNNLVGYAFTTGEVLIQSDGTPWRPLVHVRDFSNAFLAALEAPREIVHNEAFNVGRTEGELPGARPGRDGRGRGAGEPHRVRRRRWAATPGAIGWTAPRSKAPSPATRPSGRSSAGCASCTTPSRRAT